MIMNKVPLVSVIIPTHNRANLIHHSLKSVVLQTYPNIEVIIVDDGSTDNTEQVIENFKKKYSSRFNRFLYVTQNRCGPAAARNCGIHLSKGSYICFLDSDDLLAKNKISLQIDLLSRYKNIPFAYSAWAWFGENGCSRNSKVSLKWEKCNAFYLSKFFLKDEREEIYKLQDKLGFTGYLLIENVIAMPSVMLLREILTQEMLFDESLLIGEDIDLWHRIIKAYDAIYQDQILSYVRLHRNNMTRDTIKVNKYAAQMRIKNLNAIKSLLPKTTVRLIRRRIAMHLFDVGLNEYYSNKYSFARYFFFQALSFRLSIKGLMYLSLCTLPKKQIDYIRYLARQIKK